MYLIVAKATYLSNLYLMFEISIIPLESAYLMSELHVVNRWCNVVDIA